MNITAKINARVATPIATLVTISSVSLLLVTPDDEGVGENGVEVVVVDIG